MNQRKKHQAEITQKCKNTGSVDIFKVTKVVRKYKKNSEDSKDKLEDDNTKLVD